MRRRLVVFSIALLAAFILALAERLVQFDISTYPPSTANFLVLVAANLLLCWAVLGWYFAFIDRPASDYKANLRRVLEALARFLTWVLLLGGLPLLIGLVALVAPEWTLRLLQIVAWPAVVGIGVVTLIRTPAGIHLIRSAFARIRKVSALGVDLELTEAAAKEVHYSIETTFDEYRKRISSEYARQVQIRQIPDKLASVVDKAVEDIFGKSQPVGYRCTVHVPDVLFDNTLYQLLDYYPTGSGRGRTFSMRYGMIGRTWRFKDIDPYQLQGDVFEGVKKVDVLLDKWAMSPTEAKLAADIGITAFVSIVLKEEKSRVAVGILYFDSKTPHAFGQSPKPKEFAERALAESTQTGLTEDIAQIGHAMRRIGPAIAISK